MFSNWILCIVHTEDICLTSFSHQVRVDFLETENICSVASKKKKYRSIVNVEADSTISIPYVIIPMELGEYHIEVQAASSSLHDGVRKTLKVVVSMSDFPRHN